MECPYCGAELRYQDYYGKRQFADHYYLYPQSWIEKEGYIYQCPNSFSFDTEEEAIKYAKEHDITFEDWEDIVCDSANFNGHFHTDMQDNLYEGYPC
jgi:hypothetical protein